MKEQLIKLHLSTRKRAEQILKFYFINTVGPRKQLDDDLRKLTVKQITNFLKTQIS